MSYSCRSLQIASVNMSQTNMYSQQSLHVLLQIQTACTYFYISRLPQTTCEMLRLLRQNHRQQLQWAKVHFQGVSLRCSPEVDLHGLSWPSSYTWGKSQAAFSANSTTHWNLLSRFIEYLDSLAITGPSKQQEAGQDIWFRLAIRHRIQQPVITLCIHLLAEQDSWMHTDLQIWQLIITCAIDRITTPRLNQGPTHHGTTADIQMYSMFISNHWISIKVPHKQASCSAFWSYRYQVTKLQEESFMLLSRHTKSTLFVKWLIEQTLSTTLHVNMYVGSEINL